MLHKRREILNMEVVFRPNENVCLLAALWGVANGEQKQLMANGGETNVKDMFKLGRVCWSKKAAGEMVADHAIGLVVDESQSMLYDNGFTGGSKDFSIENMAGRMIDVSACFVFDLFELKMDVKV